MRTAAFLIAALVLHDLILILAFWVGVKAGKLK